MSMILLNILVGMLLWFAVCQWFTNRSHRKRIGELQALVNRLYELQ